MALQVHDVFLSLVIVKVNSKGNFSCAEIAQLGERQTEDLKVSGSNPENSF